MSSQGHRAGRIPIHPEAFSNDLRPNRKRPRQENDAHLKFIRTLPCLICGTRSRNIQAAHIKSASAAYGKRHTGAGEKASDCWTVPLCADHHSIQHQQGEMVFWRGYGIDPFAKALALFAASGDEDAAELVVREARK